MSHAKTTAELEAEVKQVEAAFAASMANRDFSAFKGFLGEDAVFFDDEIPIRGAQAVAAAWEPYYQGATPPFSWVPGVVTLLADHTLALSSGPVFSSDGQQIAVFNSVWRRIEGGWEIVFDKGGQYCPD